ncbi:hypothetical protein PtB15_1B142 [Puccinia triticina]|nr:hypothetical protein PtB15_1B142 [Puccinia triticina]
MLDPEAISVETTAVQLVEELHRLAQLCRMTDARPYRETEPVYSIDELNAREALLIQLEMSLLPSLRQQLLNLLGSLDLRALPTAPEPNFKDALEITSNLHPSIMQIKKNIESLAPWRYLLAPARNDSTHGPLKQARCDRLIENFLELVNVKIRHLIQAYLHFDSRGMFSAEDRDQVIEATDSCVQAVDAMIRFSKKNDLDIIQEHWQKSLQSLDELLTDVTFRINFSNSLGQGRSQIDPAEYTPARPGWVPRSQLIPLKLEVVHLFELAVPLIKLARIFFRRIVITPSGKPMFSLDPRICSLDIHKLDRRVSSFYESIEHVMEILYALNDEDDEQNRRQTLGSWSCIPEDRLNSCLVSLAMHIPEVRIR